MKKSMISLAIVSASIFFTSQVSAKIFDEASECPPVSAVAAHTHFDKILDTSINPDLDMWMMLDSNSYQFRGTNFYTVYGTILPGVKNPGEALIKGQAMFDAKINLGESVMLGEFCTYAQGRDGVVFSLPIDELPSISKLMSALRK